MPRYFFDVIDNGQTVPDDQGINFSNRAEARAHAAAGLLEFLTRRMSTTRDKDEAMPAENGPLRIAILIREDDGPLVRVAAQFTIEELQ